MNVGELFVKIGIQGSDTVGKSLSKVEDGLKNVGQMSLQAKAGIVAAIFALERMTLGAAEFGTSILHTTSALGINAQHLQSWQNQARKFAVSNDAVIQSFQALKKVSTDIMLGKGAPASFKVIQSKVGLDPNKMRDSMYFMNQLQKFAKTVSPDIASTMLRDLGIGEEMAQFLIRNKADMNKLHGSILSDKTLHSLERTNAAWMTLKQNMMLSLGTKLMGPTTFVVDKLNHFINGVGKISAAIKSASPEWKSFWTVAATSAAAIFAWLNPLTAVVAGLMYLIAKYDEDPEAFTKGAKKGAADISGMTSFKAQIEKLKNGDFESFFRGTMNAAPNMVDKVGNKQVIQNNNTVIHGVKNPNQVKTEMDKVNTRTAQKLQTLVGY